MRLWQTPVWFLLPLVCGCSSAGSLRLEGHASLPSSPLLAEFSEDSFGPQEALLDKPCEPEGGDWGPGRARGGDAEGHLADPSRGTLRRPVGGRFDRPLPSPSWGTPNEAELSRLLAWKPKLPVPGRLAVVEAQGVREYVYAPSWGSVRTTNELTHWTARTPEPTAMDSLRLALDPPHAAEEGEAWPEVGGPWREPFATVDPIPALFLPQQASLGSVRYAAARVGADMLLVFANSTRVYSFRNGWANFYLTLVGLLLPGEETVVISRSEGAIVSVATGYVYCVAQGEARLDESRSWFFESEHAARMLVEEAEAEAVSNMSLDLRRALAALEAQGRFGQPGEEKTK